MLHYCELTGPFCTVCRGEVKRNHDCAWFSRVLSNQIELNDRVKLPELAAYLEQVQMARQYFPERLEIVEEMPRTASGKIQKSSLRRIARGFAA